MSSYKSPNHAIDSGSSLMPHNLFPNILLLCTKIQSHVESPKMQLRNFSQNELYRALYVNLFFGYHYFQTIIFVIDFPLKCRKNRPERLFLFQML